jgi:hypothetical protein
MHPKRIQLTLFLPESESREIEQIRQTFNPAQYALIKSHVTLCREDELESLDLIRGNLAQLNSGPIEIKFGPIVRFSAQKGVMIPAIGSNEAFQALRREILKGIIETPRIQEPHITLMHPRNASCTDAIFEQIQQSTLPQRIRFKAISLIEQEIGMPWNVLETYEL